MQTKATVVLKKLCVDAVLFELGDRPETRMFVGPSLQIDARAPSLMQRVGGRIHHVRKKLMPSSSPSAIVGNVA